ncbi:VanZ family protein [Microbacterium sp. QXD-8]|uniref:VanZ family protein n=1 Tax=Microbacterium psychrotolerans TaxID=3068321 RepID=A0ABU0Z1W9_9MICO|nr:VanZ family protein [Microbacterium sp. QXD-8]MDQ7878575.1 VanZ family protein [Microbacterium sp. QXD-8]
MTTTTRPHHRAPARKDPAPARPIAAFVLYLALLVWIVLWKLELPWVGGMDRVVKLVPFVATAGQGSSNPAEVVINFLLFIPFGLCLGLLAPSWRWWRIALVLAGASLALEVTQFILAIGSTDVTDVVVNTAGGLTGLAIVAVTRLGLGGRARAVLTRMCVVTTLLALLLAALFIVSPLHLGPPPGAGGSRAPGHGLDAGPLGGERP